MIEELLFGHYTERKCEIKCKYSFTKSDSLMIIILLSSICSKGLEDGFHSLTLSKGVHVFDFNSYDVFFRKNSNSSAIISIIDGTSSSEYTEVVLRSLPKKTFAR